MGVMRMIRRYLGGAWLLDATENMIKEKSVAKGIKRTLKEDICEDNPIGKLIYETGRSDGKTEGYNKASEEYEEKLRKQAEEFFRQIKDVCRERDEYEKLLSEYEEYIAELEAEHANIEKIRDIKGLYNSLKKLRAA